MLVSRISPAPRSTPSRAHATASRPVAVRPPATKTSQRARRRRRPAWRRSRARRTARRSASASSSISSGRATAAEFTRSLSAPASSTAWASRDRADAAADRERDEDVVGGAAGELDDRVALLVRRGDVEEHELVGALGVVALGELDGVAGVADVDEVRALDDAAGVDVEARDHALEVHVSQARAQADRLVDPGRERDRCRVKTPLASSTPASGAVALRTARFHRRTDAARWFIAARAGAA